MILANKYKILKQIGQGAFGKVYQGENIRTKELVAVKVEKSTNEIKSLKYETQIYQAIGPCPGIPAIKWFGIYRDYYFMVMPLLGISLRELKQKFTSLSYISVLCFGIDMIQRLQNLHERGFIHRDVKPDNFLFGVDSLDLCRENIKKIKDLCLVDFGFCKKYVDSNNNHIPIHYNRALIGSPNYVSINIHNKTEPSRRDDLESVGYIMIYLFFPEEEEERINKNSMNELIAFKMNIIDTDSPEQESKLGFKKIPYIIKKYLSYCKKLDFEQTPDYNYIYSMLREGLAK